MSSSAVVLRSLRQDDKEELMTFDTRLKTALAILARTGIRPLWYAPPAHRLLWRLGLAIRPPHFSRTLWNFLWLWVAFMTPTIALYAAFSGDSVTSILADGALAGLSFAGAAASTYGKSAELHGLPAWEHVESPDQPIQAPSTHWLRGGL
jgi:hypothetical protein